MNSCEEGLLDGLSRRLAEQEVEAEGVFESRAVRKLASLLDVPLPNMSVAPAINCSDFLDKYQDFPVKLTCMAKTIQLDRVILAMEKTKVWERLMTEIEQHDDCTSRGVLCRDRHGRIFVLHDAWNVDREPGLIRVERPANVAGKGLVFETVETFAADIRRYGWHP